MVELNNNIDKQLFIIHYNLFAWNQKRGFMLRNGKINMSSRG
jgi:hypothetical protein